MIKEAKFVTFSLWIILTIVATVLVMSIIQKNPQVDSHIQQYIDSLNIERQKQNELIYKITQLQDSLLNAKTDTIVKLKKIYVENSNNILTLPIDKQVELLSRNLSEDTYFIQ